MIHSALVSRYLGPARMSFPDPVTSFFQWPMMTARQPVSMNVTSDMSMTMRLFSRRALVR